MCYTLLKVLQFIRKESILIYITLIQNVPVYEQQTSILKKVLYNNEGVTAYS